MKYLIFSSLLFLVAFARTIYYGVIPGDLECMARLMNDGILFGNLCGSAITMFLYHRGDNKESPSGVITNE